MFSMFGIRKAKQDMNQSMMRLSSALRINSAKDDPAGLAISTRMSSQSRGLNTGARNMMDGLSMAQTGESAAGQAQSVLQRMRELSIQADNGTMSDADKANIQKEMDTLKDEYDHVVSSTNFNGTSIIDNTSGININDGVGTTTIETQDLTSTAGGTVDLEGIDVTAPGGAQAAIQQIDGAIDEISNARASFGADMSALESRIDMNKMQEINTEQARSRIEDANMAKEMSNLMKSNLLNEASVSMLSIQNENKSTLLNLLKL